MSTSRPFADYKSYVALVQVLRVDELKTTLREINSRLGTHLPLSGLKSALQERVTKQLDQTCAEKDVDGYVAVKEALSTAHGRVWYGVNGGWSGPGYATCPVPKAPAPTYQLASGSLTGNSVNGGYSSPPAYRLHPSFSGAAGSGGPGGSNAGSGMPGDSVPLLFASSPFYRLDRAVSGVIHAPKAPPGDKKSVMVSFHITADVQAKLESSRTNPNGINYQLRFFCTSEQFAVGATPALRRPNTQLEPALIEFPSACEIKLNEVTVPCSVKGIKKQPGTAMPPDLGTAPSKLGKPGTTSLNANAGAFNRVELVYVNTEKRHSCVVYLVEFTPVPKLVEQVRGRKNRTKAEVVESILKESEDDDIVMGSSALDLRDALSMCRIDVPIRSTICSHIQCFDANTFFEVMEATPTWKCPVCSKVLAMDQLFVDGYTQDILQQCPSSVDSVIVEADGTWHDEHNKYGTSPSVRPAGIGAEASPVSLSGSMAREASQATGDGKGKRKVDDVTVLDDEERNKEDGEVNDLDAWGSRPQAKRQRAEVLSSSPAHGPDRASTVTSLGPPVVIDLTDD